MKNKLFVLILAASFLTMLFSCGGNNNKPETPKKIEVTGSAEMEIVPNEIYMTFTLKEYLDAAKQKVKLETIKTDFLALCKAAGVADSSISISSYTGNERYDYYYWKKKRKAEPDFMASISYTLIVSSPEKLDKIVAGLNENAIDNFSVGKTSHSNIEQLRKEVKTQALIASKTKADYLAESIGEEIGEALLIQEIENSYNGYYSNESNFSNTVSQTAMSYGRNNTSTPDFQKIKLRYEMKVEFKLK
ncbi:MAG: hypothetical protein A3F72_16690 [Bacteroidetes bacterium RIFCSPLOWO2_12_FULL_35_15]|nr:MAG: hypothetical protein A3F72_16690 [Bacteroidetes bacterium RIFCSPLOWO2_12_FULL_35_15]